MANLNMYYVTEKDTLIDSEGNELCESIINTVNYS